MPPRLPFGSVDSPLCGPCICGGSSQRRILCGQLNGATLTVDIVDDERVSVVTISCDESGAEGENLTQSAHRVFVHASVDLTQTAAREVMSELRARAPSQAQEFKSEQLLQPRHRAALLWLLDPGGPLYGRAIANLVDKEYFVVGKVIDLLVEEMAHDQGEDLYHAREARRLAWLLHREGARALGPDRWGHLLDAFNSLMRVKQRAGSKTTVEEFFHTVDEFRLVSRRRNVAEVLDLVWRARAYADDFQQRLIDAPDMLPALDPLVATLARTIQAWAERTGSAVAVIHDNQAVLTESRIRQLTVALGHPHPDFVRFTRPVHLVSLEQVDSRVHAGVQLADLLAGVSRRIAEAALDGADDTQLTDALQPYVEKFSLWSDDASWIVLTGRPGLGA